MKFAKKIAALGSAVVMAVSMMSMGASAYNSSEPWSARWINTSGVPTSEQRSTTVSIIYSTKGARAYCNSASNSVNGGVGYTHINSVNGNMTQKSILHIGSITCKPTYSGLVPCATFTISAKTSTTNNVYNCSGNIVSIA